MTAELHWPVLLNTDTPPGLYRFEGAFSSSPTPDSCLHRTIPPAARLNAASILMHLARGLDFPDYFNGTWEAAYDCLTDQDWLAGTVVVLELNVSSLVAADSSALALFTDLIRDAADYWDGHRVRLFCVLTQLDEQMQLLDDIPPLGVTHGQEA
jgi:ABC-type transporter Mla MlaB component